jgi:hypothetical protein
MNLKQLLFDIVIITMGVVLIAYSLYCYQVSGFEQRICDRILSKGASGTAVLSLDVLDDLSIIELLNEVREIKGVEAAGFLDVRETSCISDIVQIQKKKTLLAKPIDLFYKGKGSYEINVNYSLVNICNIKLQDDLYIESPTDKYTVYMYLGSEISEIPLGTKYTEKEYQLNENGGYEEVEVTYVVKGYMKKGQMWMADDVNSSLYDSVYYYDMDYGVINVVHDDNAILGNNLFFNINDTKNWNDIRENIKKIYSKYDIQMSVTTLDKAFDTVVKDNNVENKYLYQLAIVVMISVVFIQLCIQSSRVINNKIKYGIYFSNGILPENIIGMLCVENFIKWFISLMLAGLISFWFLYNQYVDFPEYLTRMTSNLKSFVLLPTIGISAGVMIIGMIFPIIIIGNMAPSKLIKELGD